MLKRLKNSYSQLCLNEILIKSKENDKLVKDMLELYQRFDLFCVELEKKPLQIEVALSHLQTATEWLEIAHWWLCIVGGLKSGISVSTDCIEEAATKFFQALRKSDSGSNFFAPDSDNNVIRRYVVICMAFVKGLPVEDLLAKLVDEPEITGYCRVWCSLKNPLSVMDSFNWFVQWNGSLQCVSSVQRQKLCKEAEVFFNRLTEESLKEYYLGKIVRTLFSKAEPGEDFQKMVDWTKDEVDSLAQSGIRLNDLRLLDYALGQCKEVIACEKTD